MNVEHLFLVAAEAKTVNQFIRYGQTLAQKIIAHKNK